MRNLSSYLGEVVFYYISLSAMAISWLSADLIANPFAIFWDAPWTRMFVLLGVAVVGLLILIFAGRLFKIFGFMLGLGALLGAGGSLIAGVCEEISNAYPTGFWEWVGLFFGCVLLLSVFAGILGAGLKGVFKCIMRLDFFSTLIYGMILWTGFFGIGEGIVSMMDCSVGLAILVIICSFTVGAATVGVADCNSFLDENGQLHFVSHGMGRDRVMTTDGEVFRKNPGGFTNRHM